MERRRRRRMLKTRRRKTENGNVEQIRTQRRAGDKSFSLVKLKWSVHAGGVRRDTDIRYLIRRWVVNIH